MWEGATSGVTVPSSINARSPTPATIATGMSAASPVGLVLPSYVSRWPSMYARPSGPLCARRSAAATPGTSVQHPPSTTRKASSRSSGPRPSRIPRLVSTTDG